MKRLIAIACICFATTTVEAAELGRLFFTPMQRAEMDRKRVLNIADTPVDKAIAPSSQMTLNGRITRSDGKTTTWINGVPDYDPRYTGTPSRKVKVGETIDLGSGQVQDPGIGGRIEIERHPTR